MKTENHNVTIPIADYNELLENKKFSGLVKLEENSAMYHAIRQALIHNQSNNMHPDQLLASDPMKGVTIYFQKS